MYIRQTATAGRSPVVPVRWWVVAVLGVAFWLLLSADGIAQKSGTLVIRNDRGGSVAERVARIDRLRRSGIKVEIRGDYCLSACTMYLGVPGACVAPDTVFGFHGPSSPVYGVALRPREFEYWSHLMARYYPAALRKWFLEVARNRLVGFERKSGRELIRLGLPRCAS